MTNHGFPEAFRKAGITYKFLLAKTTELIEAIETGKFKPRNKERELQRLKNMREQLLYRIRQEEA